MDRAEPAFPDLLTVTHVVRPGYLPGPTVALDPLRMGIVWPDAPGRVVPRTDRVPRTPCRIIAFCRAVVERSMVLKGALDNGCTALLVLDDGPLSPGDLGLETANNDRLTLVSPVLPSPIGDGVTVPEGWGDTPWGAVVGLFPFPGAGPELERNLERVAEAGGSFVVTAPLLLTPRDRHRILDGCDGLGLMEDLEDCLFHRDVGCGLMDLERRAAVAGRRLGLSPAITTLVPAGADPEAVRTAAILKVWARRLDQSDEESSWGWRLRRAARAVDALPHDPKRLAGEDNLRIIPGFDAWVEGFTRSVWFGGEPVESTWARWVAGNTTGR